MTKIEFVARMCAAFIQHHGYAPSHVHVADFKNLYDIAMGVHR
ncbi:TPA: hypothetical protein ACX6RM_001300 [Photobacterium damselae]